MQPKGFILSFWDNMTTTDPNPEDYKDYFENYSPEKWESDDEGSLFQFFTKDKKYSIGLFHHPDYGIALNFSIFNLGIHRQIDSWMSIGDKEKLNQYHLDDYDIERSVGMFLTPLQAWEIIKAFLERPTEMPWDFDTIDGWERLQSPKHYV